MLKIRVTYADQEEYKNLLMNIEKNYNILNESNEYKGRGKSKYFNSYLDVEIKKTSSISDNIVKI